MIPDFPTFAPLGIEHQQAIRNITANYLPYSDFNFTSLFCWNTEETTNASILNGNLVIKMADYITDETVYSVIGSRDTEQTIGVLLNEFKELKYVPEDVVRNLTSGNFHITEDRDQFDYVFSLPAHAELAGGHFKGRRNKSRKFVRDNYTDLALRKIDFDDSSTRSEISEVFSHWAGEKERDHSEVRREGAAINRLFEYSANFTLVGMQIFLHGKCVGFSINEILNDDYAICHFQKALLAYPHMDAFLTNLVAIELGHFGCRFINWEQDLGLPGLRELKTSYGPDHFLKKYRITRV